MGRRRTRHVDRLRGVVLALRRQLRACLQRYAAIDAIIVRHGRSNEIFFANSPARPLFAEGRPKHLQPTKADLKELRGAPACIGRLKAATCQRVRGELPHPISHTPLPLYRPHIAHCTQLPPQSPPFQAPTAASGHQHYHAPATAKTERTATPLDRSECRTRGMSYSIDIARNSHFSSYSSQGMHVEKVSVPLTIITHLP